MENNESITIFDSFKLTEAQRKGNKYSCVIIRAGLTETANAFVNVEGKKRPVKKYYPKELLKNAADQKFFEGVPFLIRDEADHLAGINGSTDNIYGFFSDTKWNEEKNHVEGTLNIKQGSGFLETFRDKLQSLYESVKDIGLSIFAFGKWNVKKINDEFVATVESLENVISIDLCRIGNAGGKIKALVESAINQSNNNAMKLTKEQRLNLFKIAVLVGKFKTDDKIDDLKDEELLAALSMEELDKFFKDSNESEKSKADSGNESGDPKKEGSKGNVDPENSDPANKEKSEAEKETAAVVAEAKKLINELNFRKILSESKLPKGIKDKIEAKYKKVNFSYDKTLLEEELKLTSDILAEGVNPSDFFGGPDKIKLGLEHEDKKQLAMDWIIFNSAIKDRMTADEKKIYAEAGVTGLFSFRRFYEELTGDDQVTGRYSQRKLAESVESTDFSVLLGTSMRKALIRSYQASSYFNAWKPLVNEVPKIDYKLNSLAYAGGYGDVPVVAETAAYTAATTPAEEAVTYTMAKRGYTETITREAILNDDLRLIQGIPFKMGQAAARTLLKYVFNLFVSNPTMAYDATALFHANHANLITDALASTGLQNMRLKFADQTELTSNEKLGLVPKYLIIPPALEKTAYELITAAYGRSNTTPEFLQTLTYETIVNPFASDANDWYMMVNPREYDVIELAFLNGNSMPQMFTADDPAVGLAFTNDQIVYKLRHEYAGIVVNHRGIAKAAVT